MEDSQEWWEVETDVESNPGLPVKREPAELSQVDLYRAPKKITAKWVVGQLPMSDWDGFHNKRLNPHLIEAMAKDAARGLSKRAIMARAGYHVRTWSNWVKWAEEGQEPYALWYRCMLVSFASKEEEMLDLIDTHAETDWKAAKFRLEALNREEYGQTAGTATTVNVHGDVKAGDTNSINYFTQEEALNVASIMQAIGALPQAPVVDAEVVEE